MKPSVTNTIFWPKGRNMLVLTYFPNGIFRSCWPRNWYSHQRLNAESAPGADTIRLLNLYSRPDYGFFLHFRPNYAFSDCIEISLYACETIYCAANLCFLSGQNIVLVTPSLFLLKMSVAQGKIAIQQEIPFLSGVPLLRQT